MAKVFIEGGGGLVCDQLSLLYALLYLYSKFHLHHTFLDSTGSQVAMIDFLIWPWIERLPVVAAAFREGNLSESNFPHLYAWRESMMSLSAVKDTAFDHKTHQQFYKKIQEGSADAYDIGLEE